MSLPNDVAARQRARPTGTVTFLFTDIEGSALRWERDSEAMQTALRSHDSIVRAAVARHCGCVFKTIGDAFCTVFARADDALAAALDAQRALFEKDFSHVDGLRVRMAIHTGTADERDDDYFGRTVNRVTRLLAIGHGGQVLVSGVTAELLEAQLPPQAMHDLGYHRLKDLASPEHVYQAIAGGLQREFPPLRSLDALRNNLPLQLTSFVGREADVAEIKALLKTSRLLTLCGTGGVGKTRAALQVGADVADEWVDGVWLVELAPIAQSSLVVGAVAQALGVQESAAQPLLDTVVTYLKLKRLLLILDNCEHVIGEAAKVANVILHSAPNVTLLATSREGLGIGGERSFRLTSLAVPAADTVGSLNAEAGSAYGAIILFVERARNVDRAFALTDQNAPIVANICRRLDGIPLAIELAAARVKVLSVKVVSQKLNERFRLLTGGSRTALPRQQTMRALIDWSYDLLTDRERALLRRLSIFAGGFTLELASSVCADEILEEPEVFDLLASLVDKSLVAADQSDESARYRLLESTRQYAKEKLLDATEYDRLALRHATAYLALAEDLDKRWAVTADDVFFAQAEPEMDNWRAALGWALAAGQHRSVGQQLAAALRRMWSYIAAAEGRRWVGAALKTADDSSSLGIVARLELAEAQLAMVLAQHSACEAAAQRALTAFIALGDELRAAEAQRYRGAALVVLRRAEEAEPYLRNAAETFRYFGMSRLVGLACQDMGNARMQRGDAVAARECYAEALSMYKATGAQRALATIATNLAEMAFVSGNAQEAVALGNEALDAARALDFRRGIVSVLCNMAAYCVVLGDWAAARAHAREALTRAVEIQFDIYATFAMQHLAAVATHRGAVDGDCARNDRARAARLLGFVNARLAALDGKREHTEQQEYETMYEALTGESAEIERGTALTEDEAIAEAMQV